MEFGYIYIISNALFGKDMYKLGYCDDKNELASRYNTYYPTNVIIHNTYLVCDKQLSKKLLFHKLKKYRVTQNKEFFKCPLNIITNICEEVVLIINESNLINSDNDVIDKDTCLVNKYKQSINNKILNDINNKLKKENAKNEMRNKMKNIIQNFINCECDVNENATERSNLLYTKFKLWNMDNQQIDVKFFSPIVEELGYIKIKTVVGFIFKGICIKKNEFAKLNNDNDVKHFI